jgi:hypothetical protein
MFVSFVSSTIRSRNSPIKSVIFPSCDISRWFQCISWRPPQAVPGDPAATVDFRPDDNADAEYPSRRAGRTRATEI